MKGSVRFGGGDSGPYWTGWPANIGKDLSFQLIEEIFKADGLVRWSVKHRWLLNRKKAGPRVLTLDHGQKIEFKPGQTLTHYYARRCIMFVRHGKRAAIGGNKDRALMYWAKAETEAERLYSSWLHTLAAKESARVRGSKSGYWVEIGSETRERVRRALLSLPEAQRYERGVSGVIAERLGKSTTQVRAHIQALEYGAKNKKHGA